MAIVAGSASAVWAGEKTPPVDNGWYTSGEIEAGARAFIQRPGSGFGYGSGGNFLLPTQTDSRAKFEEYGKIPPGLFLDLFSLDAGSKDGRYSFNVWGKNVGVNSQSYGLDLAQNGFQYLNLGWDQTPHLYSTSAKSLFGGVGTTNLTISDSVQDLLKAQYGAATGSNPAGLTARTNINRIINSNATQIDEIGTRRDTFSAGYRITPTPEWDINVGYAHEDRTGTKPGTLDYTSPAGFPSNVIGVPVPVDDTTQKPKASGEYAGAGPWGKYSVKLAYGGSIYTDNITQLTADNPFSNTGAVANYGTLRLGLPPSNQAHSFSASGATDIPILKSRLTTTNQWSRMTQDAAFIDTANNGLATAALPAASLNGEVRTFLTNNVLTSKFHDNVWNTLRVRYYERNNETTPLTFGNVIFADSEINAGGTPEYLSYRKTNLSEGLKWNTPIRGLTVGAGYDFERWDRTNRFTTRTDEHTGRIFADAKLASWATWRNSYSYAARRYDGGYFIDDSTWLNSRMFDLANRNRQKAKTGLDILYNRFLTVTPSAGLRWDDYPESTPNQTGVSKEHAWNVGLQVAITPNRDWRLMAGYTYERTKLDMSAAVPDADFNNGAGPNACGFPGYAPITFDPYTAPSLCSWSDRIAQNYHTVLASADWKAIPNKLDIRLDYIASWSRESHDFTPCALNNAFSYNCNGVSVNNGASASQVGLPWPDNTNLYQRFNVTTRYFVDPDVVRQMGWKGQIVAKLRYSWERNQGSAWQSDAVNSYFGTLSGNNELTGTSRSTWLAYNNPNYTAQILAASVNFKW